MSVEKLQVVESEIAGKVILAALSWPESYELSGPRATVTGCLQMFSLSFPFFSHI